MDRETAEDIKRRFDDIAGSLRIEIGGLRTEIGDLRTEIRAVDEKADRRFDDVDRKFDDVDRRFDDVDRKFDATDRRFDDIKRHFDVVGEALRSDIRLVAEGLAGLDDKFTREFGTVREEIGEVKILLRVSYGDLDRRVQALEQKSS